MANEIIKYHNDFNTVALRGYTSNELNLLMTIIQKLKDKGEIKQIFTFQEIQKLSNVEYRTLSDFIKGMDNSLRKLLNLNIRVGSDKKYRVFSPFSFFEVNEETMEITIMWNKDFMYIANEVISNFTRFELEEFIDFKSTYTKEFFRRMKQFRSTGFWDIDIEEFRRILDIPKSYKISHIDTKILKPIKEELKDYNLKIKKQYKSNGARPKVVGFRFEFDKEKKNTNIYNTALDLNIEQYEGITFQYINSKYPEESGMATIKYLRYDNNKYVFNYDVNNCYGTLKLSKSEFERLLNSREYRAN